MVGVQYVMIVGKLTMVMLFAGSWVFPGLPQCTKVPIMVKDRVKYGLMTWHVLEKNHICGIVLMGDGV
jgi:hypothetical protein